MESLNNPASLEVQEANVSNQLTVALSEFMKLGRDHAARVHFEQLINQCQYMVLAGPGIRQLNELNAIAMKSVQPAPVPQEPAPIPQEQLQEPAPAPRSRQRQKAAAKPIK